MFMNYISIVLPKRKRIFYAGIFAVSFIFISLHASGENIDDMVSVKGGYYQMGNLFGENAERPPHKVCVNDFGVEEHLTKACII